MKNKIICIVMAAFIGVFSALAYFAPKPEYSLWERRYLAKFPELSLETVWNGSFMGNFEKYATDSFALRDTFRRIRALWDKAPFFKADTNDLYIKDGYICKVEYPMKDSSLDNALKFFGNINEKYLDETNKVYLSIIPDKSYFAAGEKYPSFDYSEMVDHMREGMEYAEYIDIFPNLSLEDYYKTDTHWKQENLVDVAEKLLSSMGAKYKGEYTENTLDKDFYGVYYGQSALPVEPEEIKYLTSDIIDNCVVFDYENNKELGIYDMEKAVSNDPYEMFLSGPISLMKITNPAADSEKRLVIFRDSFGSSIAPLLVEGYSEIILVDIRYISSNYVGSLVDFSGADVLFMYSTLVLNNTEMFK